MFNIFVTITDLNHVYINPSNEFERIGRYDMEMMYEAKAKTIYCPIWHHHSRGLGYLTTLVTEDTPEIQMADNTAAEAVYTNYRQPIISDIASIVDPSV
ncbi:hypothetical protein FC093_06360 [Ilyomonas limi]|uniref:Uncharacterized protein n=1 Tax=Ilyomonas limi TaxID=2575867 RepID=A0A4U3L8X6_9BACT|nr:hypothetical protein [Ilyomonas limi]TKK70366.1 hypothetical protein FC093_06360 [Ilyomonas limi]